MSLWNNLANPVFDGVGLVDFKSRANAVLGWYCGAEVFGLIGCISLYLSVGLPTFFNNNDNNFLLHENTM